MSNPDIETAAADAINAELAEGRPPLTAQECRARYGAAFAALVKLLERRRG